MKPVYAQWLGAQSPLAENQAAHSGADQDMLRVLNLVDRGAAQLAHRFVDVVDAVNIGFAQQAAVGVDRQLGTHSIMRVWEHGSRPVRRGSRGLQLSVLRLMPREEIRDAKVDGFMPSNSAAPPGPETFPFV